MNSSNKQNYVTNYFMFFLFSVITVVLVVGDAQTRSLRLKSFLFSHSQHRGRRVLNILLHGFVAHRQN